MAKKKTNRKTSPPKKRQAKSQGRSWWRILLRLPFQSPTRYIILAVLIALLLFWQWEAVVAWAGNVRSSLYNTFGWGFVFIVAAVGVLGWMAWRRKLSFLGRQWNRSIGAILLAAGAWGILAMFNQGGRVGLAIISYTDVIGILRILALVIIGAVMVAPGTSLRLVRGAFSWLRRQFQRRPAPRPARRREAAPPKVTVAPGPVEIAREVKAEPERVEPPPVISQAPTRGQLKQVAQDVWKKYGESPELVTIDGWKLPPIDILESSPEVQFSEADNIQRARIIEEALASYGVEAKVIQINAGPTVTQFGIEPGWDRKMKEVKEKDRDGNVRIRMEEVSKTRVKVDRITSLANDMALALSAPSIRIEAPVPGKPIVGIEVPNTTSTVVSLRGVIETSVFQKTETRSKLSLALGKGAGGEAVAADLGKMPHLLIAGATGSGKTVCLDTIICCLLLYNTPNDIQFIMIDPKRVELTTFNSIPHLATPVIVDTNRALDALRWLSQEMNDRYQKLANAGVRNIDGYNKDKQGDEKIPYLILIIDELADLMMTGGDEVEQILCRLAQLSRAVGIHLVVATQRPSVDVVTGLIKANFPTRISFAVTSQVDSRTILDGAGAEKLLGRGDMLYMPTEAAKPKRLQGCYLSDTEMERLVFFWGSQRREGEPPLKIKELTPAYSTGRKPGPADDPMLEQARRLAREHEHISASFLQRRLRIGYPRAARIIDQLEEEKAQEEREGEF
ncbi:MAG: DNA translocase FtsK [Dehalococcoidales bacterium]|nr:MAG: DNA translocase FtsK [Dehalococcoidales bacterium]